MSDVERFGVRDLTYSRWHRVDSISRFVGREVAEELTYIDVDVLEYCRVCREPLLLAELARDVGQNHKNTTVLVMLAKAANVPAIVVLYRIAGEDIDRFRVKNLWPRRDSQWKYYRPDEFASRLWLIRERHRCYRKAAQTGGLLA